MGSAFFIAVLFLLRFFALNEFLEVSVAGSGGFGTVSLWDLRWLPFTLISVAVRDCEAVV